MAPSSSQGLRHVDRHDRRTERSTVGASALLRGLRGDHVDFLRPQERSRAVLSNMSRTKDCKRCPSSRPSELPGQQESETFSQGHGVTTEKTAMGRQLPQTLAARQDRAFHPWRELHRARVLENLRQRAASSPGRPSRPTIRARGLTCRTTNRAAAPAAPATAGICIPATG